MDYTIFVIIYFVLGVIFYATMRSDGPVGLGNGISALLFGGLTIVFMIGVILPIALIGGLLGWLKENV
jgi:hypothetical protein